MSIDTALHALKTLLGDRLSQSKPDLAAHGQSETHFAAIPPDAVAYPASTDDVAGIVRICAEHGCPVVGYGAGTSLEGHTLAVQGGVAVDFRDMAGVIELHANDMTVRVGPGITREALNEELRATGLFSRRSRCECVPWRDGVHAGQRHHRCALRDNARQCSRA